MAGNNKQGYYRGNYYSILVYRLLIAFAFLWLSRVLFYFFNTHYFGHLEFGEVAGIFIYGIRFDLSTLFTLNFAYVAMMTIPLPFRRLTAYRNIAGALYFIPNILGITFNITDIVYFRFTQKRMTGDIFEFVYKDIPVDTLAPQFVRDFWPYMIMLVIMAVVFVVLAKKIRFVKRRFTEGISLYYQAQIISFLIAIAISIIGIRGGFQLKPIKIITAAKYTKPRYVPLILNTPYTIIKTIDEQSFAKMEYYHDELVETIYSPVFNKYPNPLPAADSTFLNSNVVVIIMESLSSEHIGAFNRHLNEYPGFTPFLDSLMEHALVYNGFAAAKQSIEGIPAITASLPGLMNRSFINSTFAGNSINSIASLLRSKNYHTSFYHGGTNGTMDFDRFADLAGFQHYFGRKEYNNDEDFDGRWGIFDEPYFQHFAKNLDKTPQPFVSVFFSLSAHHPYTIPQQHEGKFRKGELAIQEAIMYADFALKKFFETASAMSWYENTIFVITADHTSEAHLPEYQTRFGMFRIPIVFYSPKMQLAAHTAATASQVDIMPSMLSLIGYDKPFVAFGENLFEPQKQSFAVTHLNGISQMIMGNYVLEFDGDKSLALFNTEKDALLKNNLLSQETGKASEMERLLKAYIQQFYNRMIENRMTEE
jgi:phosphoglycerol transferase MdoB-like AlkP superfamily enzyme